MHQSISLLKTAWTVLVRTIKLNSPLVYHVGNSTQVKINDGWMDGYKNGISVEWLSY